MRRNIVQAHTALIIFFFIGATIGTWILAGTVPAIIYFGLEFFSPKYFLPLGLIICSMSSIATGTSWGTASTIGIALLSIGISIGVSPPFAAGMIVSGSFFGDKMSPLSDTTNLAAATTHSEIYSHIFGMLYTTIPSYVTCLCLYTLLGFYYVPEIDQSNVLIDQIQQSILDSFSLHPLVLLPFILVLALSLMRIHAILTMGVGILAAIVLALSIQNADLLTVLNVINQGYTPNSELPILKQLLERGGIQSMMWTFSLTYIALCLGGVIEEARFLEVVLDASLQKIKTIPALVSTTIASSFITNIAIGEVFLSIIINAAVFKKIYIKHKLQTRMLSRLLEEGATLTGPLIPWTTSGAFISGVLEISVGEYLPFAFFNIINPLFSIILAFMGLCVFYVPKPNTHNSA